MELIMQIIYKNNDRKVRYLDSKCFGIFFLIKGIKTYNAECFMCIRRLRNVPALLHIGINQRADYWHQFHQQLLQMHRVSFSFDNDNNEKEKI